MPSEIEISNLALQLCGEPEITSFSNNNKRARECGKAYAPARDAELRAHNWNFATERANVSANSGAPAWGYGTAMALPGDCLRVIEVDGFKDPDDWRVEGRNLLVDDSGPLGIRYVKQVTLTGEFDAMFVLSLSARMALMIGPVFVTNTRVRELQAIYRDRIVEARRVDAIEDTPHKLAESTWVSSRLGGPAR